jgi:hypothetical protein
VQRLVLKGYSSKVWGIFFLVVREKSEEKVEWKEDRKMTIEVMEGDDAALLNPKSPPKHHNASVGFAGQNRTCSVFDRTE